jgi:glycosyltransferase involved in cell wall biosynthesis
MITPSFDSVLAREKDTSIRAAKSQGVCVIVPTHLSFRTGGAQYQAEQIVQRLAEEDVRLVYLARRIDPAFKPKGYLLEGISAGIPRWLTLLGHLAYAPRLYEMLRRHKPDVIYQRVGGSYTGVAAFYARRYGARFVWHVAHDHDVTPGRLAHEGATLSFLRYIEKWLLEYGLRRADVIIAQTQEQRRRIEHYYGRLDAIVVPNFHPAPTERIDKSGMRQVLWVANFKKWKRPEAFVGLAEKLRRLENVRFVMIGKPSNDKQWQSSLQDRIANTNALTYLGEVSQEIVNEYLAKSHLFVNTSEVEGFANTFIQAWLRQVPVVSLDADPDGVLGREGVGVACRSEERLRKAVEELLRNDMLRTEMGLRAQAYATAHHSTSNLDRLVQILLRS